MKTSSIQPTISIRLPAASRAHLDKATKLTKRSRSYIMKEALDRHLLEIVREELNLAKPDRLKGVLELAGAGARTRPRSAKEIDDHIRWLRDNE